VRVDGVLAGRAGNVLQVTTDAGTVQVVVQPHTRILPGGSGLTLQGFLNGESATGYPVSVTGGVEAGTGRVVADLIAFGAKATR
jgi:hypothetical protein